MTVPDWVQDAVFYQIFPDRFANGDQSKDPPNVHPWGSPPTRTGYQGGDLAGIQKNLDYLLDLGVNAIYLNPIFLSPANHRYHTTDYYRIDPWLGSLEDFHSLLRAAHAKKIRVVLDGVFNHSSRGFFAFNDILENEADSPYRDWFHVRRLPLRAYEPGRARNYAGWWGYKSLPKFNTSNPAVRRYLLEVGRYWIEQGLDGWRLDVPNEIDDDDFWAEFRHVVLTANPQAYLLGEIWNVWPRWANDAHFDGLMNYPLRKALLDLLNREAGAAQFSDEIHRLLTVYPRENIYAMLNLLGSHDTERFLSCIGGDIRKAHLAFLFLFGFPGAPGIYYGDEIGMRGGKDPECRGAFPWDRRAWDPMLRDDVKRFAAARHASPALRRGDFHSLIADNETGLLAFTRALDDEHVVVLMNTSGQPLRSRYLLHQLGMEAGRAPHSLLDGTEFPVTDGALNLSLGPYEGDYIAQG